MVDDKKINKFSIKYPDQMLKLLQKRLEDTGDLVDPLEGVAFQYGFNTKKLKSVVDYWRDTYLTKWETERLVRLNQFPQYKTMIQG